MAWFLSLGYVGSFILKFGPNYFSTHSSPPCLISVSLSDSAIHIWLACPHLIQLSYFSFKTDSVIHLKGWFHVDRVVVICKNRFWGLLMKLTDFFKNYFIFAKLGPFFRSKRETFQCSQADSHDFKMEKWNKHANQTLMLIKNPKEKGKAIN